MLEYKLNGDILEVKQTIFSFTKTSREYWYYNIRDWKKSSTGQKNDIPRQSMTQEDIEWVKRFYLPMVKND